MNWLYENIVSLITSTISIISVLYTTLRPIYLKWKKDRKRNLRKHLVFDQFNSAQDEINKMFFRGKNLIRAKNMVDFCEKSNSYIMEFCVFAIDSKVWELSESDFEFAIRANLSSQINKFKVYTEEAFDPIVRLKFGEYLLENQDIMVQFIQMYAAEQGMTNKQRVWFMLTIVRTYLQRMPKLLQTLNNLNGDLDAYEQTILAEL